MPSFIDITVNKPLPLDILLPNGEGSILFYLNAFTLIHIISDPSKVEIDSFKQDEFELKATVIDNVIFFCYRTLRVVNNKGFSSQIKFSEVVPWQEIPYWPNKTPLTTYQEISSLTNIDQRLLFNFILVDYNTKVVKVIRAVSVSPFFSKSFAQMCIDNHTANSFQENNIKTDRIYRQYELGGIAKSARVSSRGGD